MADGSFWQILLQKYLGIPARNIDSRSSTNAQHRFKKPPLTRASWRLLQCVSGRQDWVAGGLGFEPRYSESESDVLPLDDPPTMPRPWSNRVTALTLGTTYPASDASPAGFGLYIGPSPATVHPAVRTVGVAGDRGSGGVAILRAKASDTQANPCRLRVQSRSE